MDALFRAIERIKSDEQFGRRVFLLSLFSALFILVIVISIPDKAKKYEFNSNGEITSIKRSSLKQSEQYQLKLRVEKGDEASERDIKINTHASSSEKKQSEQNNEDKEREAEINAIVTSIELSKEKLIALPTKLSDGSRLIWYEEEKGNVSISYVIVAYIVIFLLLIKSSLDQDVDDSKKKRNEILKGLPRFTNQLLLMMNAGMILSDAFENISASYALMGREKLGFFENELISIVEENSQHRTSAAALLTDFAAKYSVKEMMRIASILTENEKRGSDVVDNLSRESNFLWDERKIIARENGKLIDTKMSYPLGLLLILLIVITMAPALLSM